MSRARRYGSARTIAHVDPELDPAVIRARELTARRLDRVAERMRPMMRALRRGTWKPERRRRSSRDAFLEMRQAIEDRTRKREWEVNRGLVWNPVLGEWVERVTTAATERAGAELRHYRVRQAVAAKLRAVAAWAREHDIADPEQFEVQAMKLERARRAAYYGENKQTGELVMRFVDRSGLALLDPSEARERQAVLCERLVPVLQAHARAGRLIYYAVFSAPNVPAGSLELGKRQLFDRFKAVILSGALPEVVGAFAVQEDPLAADLTSWNVHLNAILVVDRDRCTRLPFDLCWQLDMDLATPFGPPARELGIDDAPERTLSYRKVHYLWGAHQVELAKLKARSADAIARSIREVVKYSAKWISTKALDELAASSFHPASTELVASAPSSRSDFILDGARHRGRGRPVAPGVVDWPEARVAEWIRANQRFRRVRGWGCLYRIAKHELPPDPEKLGNVVWLGRVTFTPHGFELQRARWRSEVGSIHGDKSGHDFGAANGRVGGVGARAGPASIRSGYELA